MFSKENADNKKIRKLLKKKYPELIYVSRKSINTDCYVVNSRGLILHIRKKAWDILELLKNPTVNFHAPTFKTSGPGGDLLISIEKQIKEWEDLASKLRDRREKVYPDWKRRLKEIETTIKELRREI